MTPDDPIIATEAYDYPLTLDHLLHTALACSPAREIVHEDRGRLDYRELHRRIGRLAAGLASLGVEPGATVAVMDWDSTRYLGSIMERRIPPHRRHRPPRRRRLPAGDGPAEGRDQVGRGVDLLHRGRGPCLAMRGGGRGAAIGIPDPRWGERPLVLVVPGDAERPPGEAAIRAAVQEAADRGRINRWAVPDRIVFVESLDRTSVGKIDKKRLRMRYLPIKPGTQRR